MNIGHQVGIMDGGLTSLLDWDFLRFIGGINVTKRDKRWLVIVQRLKVNIVQRLKVNHEKTIQFNMETSEPVIISLGCVRAETEPHANKEGSELLGGEVTQAIPLEKIEPGWIYREGD